MYIAPLQPPQTSQNAYPVKCISCSHDPELQKEQEQDELLESAELLDQLLEDGALELGGIQELLEDEKFELAE